MSDIQNTVNDLRNRVEALERKSPKDKLSMVVFSGSLDKVLAAFIMATGAAAMGTSVTMFFTFWGTAALRKKARVKKDFISRMFGLLLPTGADRLKLSKMNFCGAGTAMMKSLMNRKKTVTLPQLLEMAGQLEVQINICEMSMDLMGMKREEMVDYPGLEYCGVAGFLAQAQESSNTLFI